MKLSGFEFEGPFPDPPEGIRDEAGVYVVLGVREGKRPVVLDVGQSGSNVARGGQIALTGPRPPLYWPCLLAGFLFRDLRASRANSSVGEHLPYKR